MVDEVRNPMRFLGRVVYPEELKGFLEMTKGDGPSL
jgi:hypothetical protein